MKNEKEKEKKAWPLVKSYIVEKNKSGQFGLVFQTIRGVCIQYDRTADGVYRIHVYFNPKGRKTKHKYPNELVLDERKRLEIKFMQYSQDNLKWQKMGVMRLIGGTDGSTPVPSSGGPIIIIVDI